MTVYILPLSLAKISLMTVEKSVGKRVAGE